MPGWVNGINRALNKFWTEVLDQPAGNPFRIPFVDFARGDGLKIGHGTTPRLVAGSVDESTPWVSQYRGLWGLFARDPISGENAPAGPMYNRDGSPRGSWFDPLGFAGLDKIPPPPQALEYLQKNCDEITVRQNELVNLIPKKAADLQALGIKLKGMEGNPHLAKQYAILEKKSNALADEVKNLRRERLENGALQQGLTQRLGRMKAGMQDEPRAHVRHLAVPVRAMRVRYGRAAETWAAISLSLMLFAIAALIFFAPSFIWAGLVIIMILFVLAESILRGAFIDTMTRITLFLALVSALILFIHFWDWILVGGLVALGMFLMCSG